MSQIITENGVEYQFHAATGEEIQRALQQEVRDSRLKNVGRSILKVMLLPVLFAVFVCKWIGTFFVRISAWIFYLAAGLMAILGVIYLVQGDGQNAMIGFILSIGIFLIPTVAAVLVAVMGMMQERLHDFIWSKNM